MVEISKRPGFISASIGDYRAEVHTRTGITSFYRGATWLGNMMLERVTSENGRSYMRLHPWNIGAPCAAVVALERALLATVAA